MNRNHVCIDVVAFLLSLAVVAGAETIQMPPGPDMVHRPVSMPRSEGGAVRVCTYNIGWAAGSPTHPGCWASRRYGERIDDIFVSKGVRVLDYATYDVLRPGLDLYPSDHFPVVATLKVNYPDEHHKQNNLHNDGRAQMVRTS